MLKISIVLVTTTAFATLLVAYPFTPQPSAAPGAAGPPMALAALSEQPDSISAAAAAQSGAASQPPASLARVNAERTPDPRIPPRGTHRAEPERSRARHAQPSTGAPGIYPVRSEIAAHTAPGRGEAQAAFPTRYPSYAGRLSAPTPDPSYMVRHSNPVHTEHRAKRTRSYVLASDETGQ